MAWGHVVESRRLVPSAFLLALGTRLAADITSGASAEKRV
jgi:hypothetical protein